jgi:predicted rRNA methylase YqxC with S4 and FtsJ domains
MDKLKIPEDTCNFIDKNIPFRRLAEKINELVDAVHELKNRTKRLGSPITDTSNTYCSVLTDNCYKLKNLQKDNTKLLQAVKEAYELACDAIRGNSGLIKNTTKIASILKPFVDGGE